MGRAKPVELMPESRFRAVVAQYINRHDVWQWHPSVNQPGAYYSGGLPDGFITYRHYITWVEIKALGGRSVFMGVPGDSEKSGGWHHKQRVWYERVAKPGHTPYYIVALVGYRVPWTEAQFVCATPEAWMGAEEKFGLHTPSTNGRAARSIRVEKFVEYMADRDDVYSDVVKHVRAGSDWLTWIMDRWSE